MPFWEHLATFAHPPLFCLQKSTTARAEDKGSMNHALCNTGFRSITRSLRELTALPQFIICGGMWVLLGMGLVWHWVGTIQTFFSQALASADLTLNNVLPGTSCGISLWKRE